MDKTISLPSLAFASIILVSLVKEEPIDRKIYAFLFNKMNYTFELDFDNPILNFASSS